MKNLYRISDLFIIFSAIIATLSCNKSDFLSAKTNQSLVVPQTISDFQAILDNLNYMNGEGTYGRPMIGLMASDDYYMLDADYNSRSQWMRNVYLWQSFPYTGVDLPDWDYPYRTIYYANSALEGISGIAPNSDNKSAWENVKGSALYFRAFANFELCQLFCPVYDSASMETDLGLPLRLSADANEPLSRSNIKKTYEQILNDLSEALRFLPKMVAYKTRPSIGAAYGLLGRVYLNMGSYKNAFLYADSCLSLQHSLIDYNTLSSSSTYPIVQYNQEVVIDHNFYDANNSVEKVDTTLYNLYEANDLRKSLYFKQFGATSDHRFYGSYTESSLRFSGISVNEMLLIRAECNARLAHLTSALDDLNELLINRYKSGTYTAYYSSESQDVLNKILLERRKELVFRNIRWQDLRRLNKQSHSITIKRIIGGATYALSPHDSRYVFPIPDNVISLNPQIIQNEY
ncbi:RagB/SusD family nutrient uptake outer membrane protein [Rhizosphaericola mali]|uniref:RagB/SusD family nutrient uptake outer membrane protein n=1 Tax=Rhizosphaericola mali TaxID=2545455 RepID=A0A5P2G9E0_9BACT|nr:RagB/SusD family nutrient uptake outer membrane protein [Rhizosphaericola mali]